MSCHWFSQVLEIESPKAIVPQDLLVNLEIADTRLQSTWKITSYQRSHFYPTNSVIHFAGPCLVLQILPPPLRSLPRLFCALGHIISFFNILTPSAMFPVKTACISLW